MGTGTRADPLDDLPAAPRSEDGTRTAGTPAEDRATGIRATGIGQLGPGRLRSRELGNPGRSAGCGRARCWRSWCGRAGDAGVWPAGGTAGTTNGEPPFGVACGGGAYALGKTPCGGYDGARTGGRRPSESGGKRPAGSRRRRTVGPAARRGPGRLTGVLALGRHTRLLHDCRPCQLCTDATHRRVAGGPCRALRSWGVGPGRPELRSGRPSRVGDRAQPYRAWAAGGIPVYAVRKVAGRSEICGDRRRLVQWPDGKRQRPARSTGRAVRVGGAGRAASVECA